MRGSFDQDIGARTFAGQQQIAPPLMGGFVGSHHKRLLPPGAGAMPLT